MRIFCFIEKIKNMTIWTHYAENYKGIALGLKLNKEVDSPLQLVKSELYF